MNGKFVGGGIPDEPRLTPGDLEDLLVYVMRVPAVYSDVPAYRGVVTHGVNGFLARSPADWRACLQMLVEDAGLRATMGDAARETARAWTIEERVTLWEQAYEGLL